MRPNAGLTAAYRKQLLALVGAMQRSVEHWLCAAYRANEPAVLAMDASPAAELQRRVRRLGRYWQRRFDEAAPRLARHFAKKALLRSDAALRAILRDGGWSVRFKMTRAMQDVSTAAVAENVSLIRSIPQAYHAEVEGMVMRSVQAGRDLEQLAKDLRARYGVTKRRADLIALDQNNKATAVFTRVRQRELGITKAVWQHSHAGKEPRPTHVANDGEVYDPAVGWFDPDPKVRKRIWPGELIRCRCTSRPVVLGFD